MWRNLTSFAISLAVFSVIILALGLGIFSTVLKEYYMPVLWIIFFYFVIILIASRLFVLSSSTAGSSSFNRRYFISSLLKIMFHLAFIIIYLINTGENMAAFIFSFLSAYIIFTTFDTYTLHRFIKKTKQF